MGHSCDDPKPKHLHLRIHTHTDGLAKGRQAWHATYNRIYLLNELYRLRHQHRHRWVLFMDPGKQGLEEMVCVSKPVDDHFSLTYPPHTIPQNVYHTDAVFVDPKLSVEDLLDERYAVIGCRGGDDPSMWWDINIGVAFCTWNGTNGRVGRLPRINRERKH